MVGLLLKFGGTTSSTSTNTFDALLVQEKLQPILLTSIMLTASIIYNHRYSTPPSDVVDAPMPVAITLNDQQFSNMIDFWFYDFPSIYMLDPNRGPDTGGTHVLLKGNNFDPFADFPIKNYNDTFCRFGPLGMVPVQIINSTKAVCIAPSSFLLKEVEVEITLNTRDWTRDGNIFSYYRPPFVYDIDPLMGPVRGGTEVFIHGSNFEDTGSIRCKFGEDTVPGEYININELKCVSPPTDKPGYVTFQVAVHEDDFSSPELFKYLYYDTPVIHSIEPTCGPERGYTQIMITGDNFIDPGFDMVYCIFNGTIYMNATVYEPHRIKCSSPPVLNRQGVNEKKISFYDVSITLNKRDISGPVKRFNYYKEVSISSVIPSGGPIDGGTIVKIIGKGFKPACACNVTVRFGTFQVRPVNFTDNVIYVRAPNVTLPDDVVVSYGINGQQYNPDLTLNYKDKENTFTYYGVPLVAFYYPRRGPSCGGTTIKIVGFGFAPFKDNEGNEVKKPVWIRMRRYNGTGLTEPKEAEYVDNENIHWKTPPGDADSKHILELSLNKEDFYPILPVNQKYSYTYYNSPRVEHLYPPYGPVESELPVLLFVKGKNFDCPDEKCENATCRFGTGDQAIITPATKISSTEIHCYVPKYGRPDVVPVEISLDQEYYTNDNKEYGFYDPYVWYVKPKMVSRKGNTTITIHGYGFVNTTGSYLKVRYGFLHKRLSCRGGPCVVMAKYVDQNTIVAETLPYNEIVYNQTRLPIGKDPFAVEVSVYGDDFTKNNATIFYFTEPTYGDPLPTQVAANGGEALRTPADFHTNKTDGQKGDNDEEIFRKYGNATCRFKSISGKVVYTKAQMIHNPIGESDSLNSVYCPSPEWDLPEGVEKENVILDISVNGADYSGGKVVRITEKLDIYRIFPPCGPTYGKTKLTLIGTGLKYFDNLHLKWGILSSILVDRERAQTVIYNKDKAMSQDPYENEILSMNEDVQLYFKNNRQYHSVYTYSPRLPNWDRTHGGQVYLELGRTLELQVFKSKSFQINNFGTSFLEYYYYQQPILKDMKPHGGPTTGGTVLAIRGSWFKYMPEYGVIPFIKIGDKVSRCEFDSTVRIVCRSPPNNYTASNLPVTVGLNGVDFGEQTIDYHYYYPPTILDIQPKSGQESGGTRIHVRGIHFSNLSSPADFKCRFTSVGHNMKPKYVPAIYENSTSVICLSPGGWTSGSKVNIDLTFNGEDYTSNNETFTFYSIFSAFPRSGPSDGTAGMLTIDGSGFKDNGLITCSFDKTKYKPVEITWNYIKCKIPKPKNGDDFFGTVPLDVVVNGIDQHNFEGGFHYYPQINVTDFYPKHGPAKGKGIIKIYGTKFRADFALARPSCKFGKYIGKAEVLSENEMVCHIPPIDAINQTYKVEAALNGQSFIPSHNRSEFTPYGIYDIEPYSGPYGIQTPITVAGEGFPKDGKPKCRFGIPGDYAILDGKVLSNQRMLCLSPKSFHIIPKVMEMPFAVPFSISFYEDKAFMAPVMKHAANPMATKIASKPSNTTFYKFDSWTETGHVFRFYNQPIIAKVYPKTCKVKDIIDVYAYASVKAPYIQRNLLFFIIYSHHTNL